MTLRQTIEKHIANQFRAGEHYLFPQVDWQREVEDGDTTASLAGWRATKVEIEADGAESAIDALLHLAPRPLAGDITQEDFNQRILSICSDLRMLDAEVADRARQTLQEVEETFVFGSICGNVPKQMEQGVSRIAHLGHGRL